MIETGVGQTERPELGQRRREPGRLPEAENRDMRKPRAFLPSIDAKRLEPLLQRGGERSATAFLIVEYEHADAARLAVARRGDDWPAGVAARLMERGHDVRNMKCRRRAEEGQRD